jgi:hypothetical protein
MTGITIGAIAISAASLGQGFPESGLFFRDKDAGRRAAVIQQRHIHRYSF